MSIKIDRVQPVTKPEDVNSGDFSHVFSGIIQGEVKKLTAQDVLSKIKESCSKLTYRTGIDPNGLIISSDCLMAIQDTNIRYEGIDIMYIYNLKVILAGGHRVIQACII